MAGVEYEVAEDNGRYALTPRLIFFLIRPFKQWPKTFAWTATIDLDGDPAPTIDSRWRRV